MDKKVPLSIYVFKSKYRTEVLKTLVNNPFQTPSEILKKTPPKYISHMSRTMRELEEKELISCENPKDNNYKVYFPTELGIKVEEEIKKYNND